MNFQRFRNDKRFRTICIIVFIILVLMQGNSKKEIQFVSPETCYPFNTMACEIEAPMPGIPGILDCLDRTWGAVNPTKVNECESAGCFVTRWEDSVPPETIDAYQCANCVPSGFRAKSDQACCTKLADPKPYKNGYDSLCRNPVIDDDGTVEQPVSCSAMENSLGSMLNAIPGFTANCKMKFYIIAIGGGFLMFAILMMAM